MLTTFLFNFILFTALFFTPIAQTYEPDKLDSPFKPEKMPSVLSQDFSKVEFSAPSLKKASPPVITPTDLTALFARFSQEYSVDQNLLTKIAACESHFNANSVNGDYGGMFQYSSSTWQTTRTAMSLDPNPDLRFNAEEAIKTTAYKISRGGSSAWPVCRQ